MPILDQHITIPSNVSYNDDLDFQFLRDAGQQYIQDLSRKIWTDYNIHDPGITIMELLCYAITDLGLRIDQPIENLVASADDNFAKMHEQFKSAKNILPCNPVTVLDYRKLFKYRSHHLKKQNTIQNLSISKDYTQYLLTLMKAKNL